VERGHGQEPRSTLFDLTLDKLGPSLNLGTDDEAAHVRREKKRDEKCSQALTGRPDGARCHHWIHALAIADVGESHGVSTRANATSRSMRWPSSEGPYATSAISARRKANARKSSPRSRKNPPKDEADKAASHAARR